MDFISKAYAGLYEFIASNKVRTKEVDPRSIHAHLIATLSTSFLMWAYAVTASLTIDSPIPGIVGITCSIIHLLSPLLFKVSNNVLLVTLVMLTAGYIHQGTYAFFTGGFNSHILIWYGVIPMLAGVIEGIRATVITALTVGAIASGMFLMELAGYPFPNQISATGRLVSQFLLVFGFIGISTIMIVNYIKMAQIYESMLKQQKDKTQTLLQILLHDISNRIQNITLINRHVRIANQDENLSKYYGDIDKNVTILHNVIHSVRRMHVLDIEKKELKLTGASLKKSLANAIIPMEDTAKSKGIQFSITPCDGEILCDPIILENQILTNILSNCVKFSPEGSNIVIKCEPCPSGKYINIKIKDQGIGMPQEILENLFNPRIATTRLGTKSEKGTGLGMIIAKSMLDKMGGRIEIISSSTPPKTGTTFHLSLLKA